MKIKLAVAATVLSLLAISSGANAQTGMMRSERGMSMGQTQSMRHSKPMKSMRKAMPMRSNKGGMTRGRARAGQVHRMNDMR